MKFTLIANAKINLGLRIVGKRPDGYHDLQSLMVPLDVGDALDFEEPADPGLWEGACDRPDVPIGPGSLMEKAFRWAAKALGYAGGLKVSVRKVIPIGAGLGGGSSDAAAVMRAVERLAGRALSPETYPEIAYGVGADVPFFLRGGANWVLGIGEEVRPVEGLPALHVLLIHPGVGIPTKWVYSRLKIEALTAPPPAASLPSVFESFACLSRYLTNDLESVVLPHYPVVGEMKEALLTLGADAALMSGSGSTVFGLYSDPKKRDQALEALRLKHSQWWICGCSGVV